MNQASPATPKATPPRRLLPLTTPAWRVRWINLQQSSLHALAKIEATIDTFTRLRRLRHRRPTRPAHLVTGIRGEEHALFHLRRLGYTIVARRWATPLMPGDVDLIAWDGPHLCFLEVKSRTGRDLVPAEFAVDQAKQDTLRRLARIYRKRIQPSHPHPIPIRFDVLSVYFDPANPPHPEVEVFRGAFSR